MQEEISQTGVLKNSKWTVCKLKPSDARNSQQLFLGKETQPDS